MLYKILLRRDFARVYVCVCHFQIGGSLQKITVFSKIHICALLTDICIKSNFLREFKVLTFHSRMKTPNETGVVYLQFQKNASYDQRKEDIHLTVVA